MLGTFNILKHISPDINFPFEFYLGDKQGSKEQLNKMNLIFTNKLQVMDEVQQLVEEFNETISNSGDQINCFGGNN